jgi:hypothetical protein
MNDIIRGILGRILSQEIAHQEIWAKREIEQGFESDSNKRDTIIQDIRVWMIENGIEFREDFYYETIGKEG